MDHNEEQQDEVVEHLKEIKEQGAFEKIGVVDLTGRSLDDTGKTEKIQDTEFLNSMYHNQNYVSNVQDISDTMMIAVPITRNGQVTGAIWDIILFQEFDVNTIKLDRLFFLNSNEKTWKVVKVFISLAHELKITVVAEGVENRSQIEKLKEINCDLVQGYYYSKPLPEEEFIYWVSKRG